MKHSNKYLLDSLNKILDLQIDAIHELLENGPVESINGKNIQANVFQRKELVDQLVSLILDNGGKIDKRTNITGTPHNIVGEEVSPSKSLPNPNDQLLEQYSAIINDDRIPKYIIAVLREHYKCIIAYIANPEIRAT